MAASLLMRLPHEGGRSHRSPGDRRAIASPQSSGRAAPAPLRPREAAV